MVTTTASIGTGHGLRTRAIDVRTSAWLLWMVLLGLAGAATSAPEAPSSASIKIPMATPERPPIVVLGAKVSAPIGHRDDPAAAGGVPWYSPAYNDVAWPAGPIQESNSVPPNRSKLWRIMVRVDATSTSGMPVRLKLFGDDALRLYVDGYLVGKYGAISGGWAGDVSVDVTDRMTPGFHLVAVRLDNGSGDSRLLFRVSVPTPGSAEFLKEDNWFWKVFGSTDAQARHQASLMARAAARTSPQDQALRRMALHTYYRGPVELRDIAAAEREVADMQRLGILVSIEDRAGVARAAGKLEAVIPELRARAAEQKSASLDVLLGDALRDVQDPAGAVAAYVAALGRRGANSSEDLMRRSQALNALLDVGECSKVTEYLPHLVRYAQQHKLSLSGIAMIYERLGDRRTAQQLYARDAQASPDNGAFREVMSSFTEGNFTRCLHLIESDRDASSGTWRTEIYVQLKTRILGEMGRVADAAQAASLWKSDGDPDDHVYLLRYLRMAKAVGQREAVRSASDRIIDLVRRKSSQTKYYRPSGELLGDLVLALKELGLDDAAREHGKMIQRLVPDAPLPANQWQLGRAAWVLGQRDIAIVHLQKARALDSTNYWITKDLSAFESEKQK